VAINDGRRKFLAYPMRQVAKMLQGFMAELAEDGQGDEFDRFFQSYESSYALTLAYPDDIIIETARQCGIETEGRQKLDIIKELFIKRGGY
jgi:hypothetical protein